MSSCAVEVGEVPALYHEVGDNAVEFGSSICGCGCGLMITVCHGSFSRPFGRGWRSAEGDEVVTCFGGSVGVELEDDSAGGGPPVMDIWKWQNMMI